MKTTPTMLLIYQIIAHIALGVLIVQGTWWQWLIAFFVFFLNGCLGMTMVYHRLLSHKSWNCPRPLEILFALFATIGLTGPAISWVAIHRKHHSHMDTEKDPHAPKHKGWFWAHFLSMYAPVDPRYAAHLLRDKFYVFQHRWYFEICLTYGIILYLIDPAAVIYAWLAPAAILWNAGSSIVSTSHRNGKVNNDLSLALLVWGEGYHDEHHKNAGKKRFGKWDLGGKLIELIEGKNK